jgi:hypothetical protein
VRPGRSSCGFITGGKGGAGGTGGTTNTTTAGGPGGVGTIVGGDGGGGGGSEPALSIGALHSSACGVSLWLAPAIVVAVVLMSLANLFGISSVARSICLGLLGLALFVPVSLSCIILVHGEFGIGGRLCAFGALPALWHHLVPVEWSRMLMGGRGNEHGGE